MVVEQIHDVPRHPRREVHAVRDVADRHVVGSAVGPEGPPDLARHLAMTLGDAVHVRRQPKRRHGHVELVMVLDRMPPERGDALERDAHLLPDRARALRDLRHRE
jgi:hypothetical protein